MAQFNIANNDYQIGNKTLFEVSMDADEHGRIMDRSYNLDALGRRKGSADYSIFSAEATLLVPSRVWEMVAINNNSVPATLTIQRVSNTYVTSQDGMLTVKSGTANNFGYAARTKEFIRVQPNRGQLFSWSAIYPNPNTLASRVIGPLSVENGLAFVLQGTGTTWQLLYQRRNKGVMVTTVDLTPLLPEGFDPSKGHLYDIQLQWRGVGNINVFVDEELIYTEELIGTLSQVSLSDNALPFAMISVCRQTGTEVITQLGCVDVSTEGGTNEPTLFGSVSTGDSLVTVTTSDTAVLALRVPRYVTYNGNTVFNTRGVIADKLVTWTRDEALTKVHMFRDYDAPALSALTWSPVSDSALTYLVGGTTSALTTAFVADSANSQQVVQEWADLDLKNAITNESKSADYLISPGDILVITVKSITTNKGNATTLYYSEKL
jgi:hypothetical protein